MAVAAAAAAVVISMLLLVVNCRWHRVLVQTVIVYCIILYCPVLYVVEHQYQLRHGAVRTYSVLPTLAGS